MKVWVLSVANWDDNIVLGVTADEEVAQKWEAQRGNASEVYLSDEQMVDEFPLDLRTKFGKWLQERRAK